MPIEIRISAAATAADLRVALVLDLLFPASQDKLRELCAHLKKKCRTSHAIPDYDANSISVRIPQELILAELQAALAGEGYNYVSIILNDRTQLALNPDYTFAQVLSLARDEEKQYIEGIQAMREFRASSLAYGLALKARAAL